MTNDVEHEAQHLAIDALKAEEGYRRYPYPDTGGSLAVGYGHNLHTRGVSKPQAEMLLHSVVGELQTALRLRFEWYERLSPARQAALIEMAYQMGVEGLVKFKRTLALIERGQFNDAADNMLRSLWAHQTPERAQRVAERFRRG